MEENKVEQYKANMLTNAINAFNEGYRLGREYGHKVFNNKRKIKVEYIDDGNGELEFTKYGDGIINYGRTLPF